MSKLQRILIQKGTSGLQLSRQKERRQKLRRNTLDAGIKLLKRLLLKWPRESSTELGQAKNSERR